MNKQQQQRDEIKESPPALTPPPVARRLLLLRPFWAGISQHQWPPGSPSPLGRISLWRAAQRVSRIGICPLSILSLFPPLSRASPVGLSIGCSGGRDVPASRVSCSCRLTSSICHRLDVQTVLGTCPLARVRTSVGRIRQPEASRYSLGWVSCSQLCLSACSHDVCCICRPPTQPSPPSLLLRFVWSCSAPRCTLVLSLCLSGGPLALDSLGGLLPHFRGCPCVPGPSGSRFQYRRRGEFSRCG